MTRPRDEVERALELHRSGWKKTAIARALGIPRGTIQGWIKPRYVPKGRGRTVSDCFRCEPDLGAGADYVCPGPKWTRPIVLKDWQSSLVRTYPHQLIRGLIHSDGCRGINRIRYSRGDIEYRYARYTFSNKSDDIRGIFTDACDLVGVRWTYANARNVAISRRDDVELVDRFVGPKS